MLVEHIRQVPERQINHPGDLSCFLNDMFELQELPNDNYMINYNYPTLLQSKADFSKMKLIKNHTHSFKKYKYQFENQQKNRLKISKNKKTITYKIEDIDVHYIHEDDNKVSTLKELIEGNSTILFDNSQFFYFNKTLFHDSQLNDSEFLRYFSEEKNLENSTSEKGEFLTNSNNFSNTSIFHILEKRLQDNRYTNIICDDLGNERADYIAFDENRLGFFHAKYKKVESERGMKSASALHDVVSQALKNLVFLDNIENINLEKTYEDKWSKNIINNQIQTQIERIRKSDTPEKIVDRLIETNRQINVQKYMVLVVNFISKSEIDNYLQNKSTDTQIQQMIWLLSSFISTCQEMNIIPQIICKP